MLSVSLPNGAHQNPQTDLLGPLPSSHSRAVLSPWPIHFHEACALLLAHLLRQLSSPFSRGAWKILARLYTTDHVERPFLCLLWLAFPALWRLPFSCKKSPTFTRVKNFYRSAFVSWLPGTKGAFCESLCCGHERLPQPRGRWTESLSCYSDVLCQALGQTSPAAHLLSPVLPAGTCHPVP